MRRIAALLTNGFIPRMRVYTALIAFALLVSGPVGHTQSSGATVASGLSVQFTDNYLDRPDWRVRLNRMSTLGATVVRIDLNWPWIEKQPGRYDWTLYDAFAAELEKLRLRPLFILNRPNPLYGTPYDAVVDGKRDRGAAAPSTPPQIAAFARWAAAAAERYQHLNPIWELWNEPDQEGFWPPKPAPANYVLLAREACVAIKQRVPNAFVAGPAAAQMPTVWRPRKPLIQALLNDNELLTCLDAISLHTHRFTQAPETVSRDYAVLRDNYLAVWPAGIPKKPIIDSEWGDSVYRRGISEDTQALWLPRMFLTNLMEQVRLTNWYCLMDVGTDDGEIEDRFGLLRADGTTRPAFQAYKIMAHEIGGLTLRETIARFDVATARGVTILRFCDETGQQCKLAVWSTEGDRTSQKIAVPGWRRSGPAIDYLGREDVSQPNTNGVLEVQPRPSVSYIPVSVAR
jgi:polysaccharide biosynthesis protein PslG